MNAKFKFTYIIIFFIALFTVQSYSQTFGKIISKSEADSLFGKVLVSIDLSNDSLQIYSAESDSLLMFKINNDSLFILDNKRNALYPISAKISSKEIFTVYETQKLNELMNRGTKNINYVELRQNVLTITNGIYTIEYGSLCPPFCQ